MTEPATPTHWFAGRIAGTWGNDYRKTGDKPMVTFCTCGLGFFGRDTDAADQRFHEHLGAQEAG